MKRVPALLSGLLLVPLLVLLGACSSPTSPPSGTGPPTEPTQTTRPSTPPATSDPAPSDPDPLPAYSASVREIGPELRERMSPRHDSGCPLRWRDLRYLELSYVGFDSQVHIGEMVVHRRHADAVSQVFGELYDARWPIAQMRLVDDYLGDDDRSMAANNTSAYNCRRVPGSDSWSEHAHGAAIDINPVQNPYVSATFIVPPAGRRFAPIDRAEGTRVPPGVIQTGGIVVDAFARIGWEWGGDWTTAKDFQHFSASGD